MIAEIKGKISSSGSNLNDRLEDQLTSDVFGALRYIPYNDGLKHILDLSKTIKQDQIVDDMNIDTERENQYQYIGDDLLFWDKKSLSNDICEPDLIFKLNNDTIIIIEVKYNSGLSSDDESNDEETALEESKIEELDIIKESRNQLNREFKYLDELYKGYKNKYVILLGRRYESKNIIKDLKTEKLNKNNTFGYIGWEDIYFEFKEIKESLTTDYSKLVIQDIINLLERKRLYTFTDVKIFKPDNDISSTSILKFNYKRKKKAFKVNIDKAIIKEDLLYVFK